MAIRIVLISILIVLLSAVSADAASRVALIVGNGDYALSSWKLANPPRDARALESTLERLDFDVDVVVDASEEELEAAITRFRSRLAAAGEQAVGLFYYAGHAAQDDGKNLLVPVDATAATMDDLWSQSVRLGEVTRAMERAGNATNFVILDACRDVPLPAATRSAGGRGLAAETRSRGLLIAYATAPGSVALDGAGENSPYTAALVRNLSIPGLSAEQMFKRVATEVEAETGRAQQPWFETGLRGADFCFSGCEVGELDARADEVWRTLQSVDDVSVLETFASTYEGTPASVAARERVRALKAVPASPVVIERALVLKPTTMFDRRSELANRVGSVKVGEVVDVLERLPDRRWVEVRAKDGARGYVLDVGALRPL